MRCQSRTLVNFLRMWPAIVVLVFVGGPLQHRELMAQTVTAPQGNQERDDLQKLVDQARKSRVQTGAKINDLRDQQKSLKKQMNAGPLLEPESPENQIRQFMQQIEDSLRESRTDQITELTQLRVEAQQLLEKLDKIGELERKRTEQKTIPPTTQGSNEQPADPPADQTAATNDGSTDPQTSAVSFPNAKRLTLEPVDNLALANNLVAAGDNETALKIYQQLIKTTTDANDIDWIHYQMGICSRRLADFASAEAHFRNAAEARSSDVYAANAKWWIDQVGELKTIHESIDQLERQLGSLRTPKGNQNVQSK